MSKSVRVPRRGHGVRLICLGAALMLLGGGLITALLAMTFTATQNLVVAASSRPIASDGWRRAGKSVHATRQEPARRDVVASIYADQYLLDDVFHTAEASTHADEALEAKLVEASSLFDRRRSAERSKPLQSEPEAREAMLEKSPRVISPNEPVQMASLIPATRPVEVVTIETAPAPTTAAEADRAPAPTAVELAEPARLTPIPTPRPADFARVASAPALRTRAEPVRLEAPDASTAAHSRPAALAYATPELETKSEGPTDFFRRLLDQENAVRLPERGSGTAVYDIASATVRLPNGERLEAHSGLGHRQDNPSYVREKNHGPTPPNVYDLRMREARFHGAEAIRLLPRDQKKVFNRDGLLAHPYMYVGGGSRSQSNGCVVFKDYGRFLRAFKAGEVARLVVVPSMAELSTYASAL